MTRVAVIGAGMAGLAAASRLHAQGCTVVVYEKSRGVGGRATARRVAGWCIDHGAQVVQTPDGALTELLHRTDAQQITLPVWTFDQAGTMQPGDAASNAEPRWYWRTGMSTLARALATGLDIRFQVAIKRLVADRHHYSLYDTDGTRHAAADAVILTPPGPQTAAIIATSSLDQTVQQTLLDSLGMSSYRRCLSVALAYPQRPALPWYAAVNLDRQHNIAWLAHEHVKDGHAPEGRGLLLAQMSHAFSMAHWDDAPKGTYGEADQSSPPLPVYVRRIHAQVQTLIGADLDAPLWADIHRWRYALPDGHADFATLNSTGSGLYFAGDLVNAKGRVHEAIARGWQVAEMFR